MKWLRDRILREVISWLEVGAWCGLCGNWMEHELTYKQWPYSICNKCKDKYELSEILKSCGNDVRAIVGNGNVQP